MAEKNMPEVHAQQSQEEINEILRLRREKLAQLVQDGNDPFTITKYDVTHHSDAIKADFDALEGQEVSIAGRMMAKRIMGKASFCNVQDFGGSIQCYVARDMVGEEPYKAFKKYDIGDIVGIRGEVFRTKTGEISVKAVSVTLLSKSLQVLPEKYHGLTNTDMRYRQRYVDLIVNPEVKDTFKKRSQILRELRSYLDGKGFLEVDTPILTPFEIGAAARPFLTHHNTLDMDMVLRIETELYLKRLIVGGMDRVYEVGRIFRNEGMDTKHNPEFTTIELYQAYTDYHGMMDLVEEMMKTVAQNVCGTLQITYQGKEIDLSHWERMTMVEAVKKYSGVDFAAIASDEEAVEAAKAHNVALPEIPTKGAILAEFFDAFVEENLIQPTFIYDYPVENSPLAKRKVDDPRLYGALRVLHQRDGVRQRVLRAERSDRPEGPLRAAGGGAPRARPELQGAGRLRLHHGAGIRPAADGRPRLRRRPSRHAADGFRLDPRRAAVPDDEAARRRSGGQSGSGAAGRKGGGEARGEDRLLECEDRAAV